MKKIMLFFILFMLIPISISAKEIKFNNLNLLTSDRIVTNIDKNDATNESYVTCTDEIYIPYKIVSVIRTGVSFIKIGVPIIFIIMGMLDFGKVVLGKPDKEMDKAKKSFGYRLLSAALVFLVVSIVEMVLPIITTEDKVLNCTKCIMLDDEHCEYVNIDYPTSTPSPTNTPTIEPTVSPTPSSTPSVNPTLSSNPEDENDTEEQSVVKESEN